VGPSESANVRWVSKPGIEPGWETGSSLGNSEERRRRRASLPNVAMLAYFARLLARSLHCTHYPFPHGRLWLPCPKAEMLPL